MSSKPKEHQDTETDSVSARQAESSQTSAPDFARHEEIRIRAYEIYIERDGQPGDELSDWLQAERDVESRMRREKVDN